MFNERYKLYYGNSKQMHKQLNVKWLLKNGFISLSERPVTLDYLPVERKNKAKYVFIGEYNQDK